MREWLKNMRTEKSLTMKEMGAKLGVSESYYCAIESGERQKKMDVVVAAGLAAALDVPISVIIHNERTYPVA